MSVKERLRFFLKSENITISDFEKSIKVANGYVNSISKSVGIDKIESIVEKFPNVNLNWLLTGKGEMLLEKNTDHNQINIKDTLNIVGEDAAIYVTSNPSKKITAIIDQLLQHEITKKEAVKMLEILK